MYADQGISGYCENRPSFQAMMEKAKRGEIDLIVTKSISRFARNTVTVLKAARELKELGMSENNKWSIQKKFERGETMINTKRFMGYDKDPYGDLVINQKEARGRPASEVPCQTVCEIDGGCDSDRRI